MSIGLSPAYVTLFDAEVKQAYQGKAALVGATRQRRGVEGNTIKFPKVRKGVATLRVPQTDVVLLVVDKINLLLTHLQQVKVLQSVTVVLNLQLQNCDQQRKH